MCRQVGLILGRKRRRAVEQELLMDLFTELLLRSEPGGPHATGIALLRSDGSYAIAKRAMPALSFIDQNAYWSALNRFDNRTTVLMGHTRWRTRGCESNPRNNHPLRTAHCLGTHNGTITNAEALFKRYRLPRRTEVDSELLLRLADRAVGPAGIVPAELLHRLGACRGQLSAVLAALGAPGRVVVLKGNKPLEFRYSRRHRAVAYATDAHVLEDAIDASYLEPHDWRPMLVDPMTLLVFDHQHVLEPAAHPLTFQARERRDTILKGVRP